MDGVKFINKLVRYVINNYPRFRVRRWVYGDKYLAIENEAGGLGITHVDSIVKMVWRDPDNILNSLDTLDPNDLIYFIQHPNPAYKYVGHAYINSIVNTRELLKSDAGDVLNTVIEGCRDAVIVGYMKPIYDRLSRKGCKVYIVEASLDIVPEDRRLHTEVYPWWSYEDLIIGADILILTGSTISNNTIGYLLEKAIHVPYKIILGPSTTLSPEPFREYGVRFLGGSIILDNDKAIEIISSGGGYHTLKSEEVIRNVTLDLEVYKVLH